MALSQKNLSCVVRLPLLFRQEKQPIASFPKVLRSRSYIWSRRGHKHGKFKFSLRLRYLAPAAYANGPDAVGQYTTKQRLGPTHNPTSHRAALAGTWVKLRLRIVNASWQALTKHPR